MDNSGSLYFAFLYDIFASLPTTTIRNALLKNRKSYDDLKNRILYDDITPLVQSQQIT